jgi:hypothetical protein
MACASGANANVYDIGDNAFPGGSLTDPVFLYSVAEPGVGVGGSWHSASFTWDGEVLILGWEPGGGAAPECEETDPDVKKSYFFYDAQTGAKLGQFVLPRPQTAQENCTIHNYNVIPTDKRYVLVAGNYQAGISVVDFTDPANAVEVAYADPPPLVPTQLGGDWSTYYYIGRIYESDITRGLLIWNLSGKWDAGQAVAVPEPADIGVHAAIAVRARARKWFEEGRLCRPLHSPTYATGCRRRRSRAARM